MNRVCKNCRSLGNVEDQFCNVCGTKFDFSTYMPNQEPKAVHNIEVKQWR